MIRHGTQPAKVDARDYSFHRTFPHFGAAAPAELPLLDYSFDARLTMRDQNADGLPWGCTGYCQSDCKTDQDKVIYDPGFTYRKTCFMEEHGVEKGCDIRTSTKSLRVYGALRADEIRDGMSQADQDALAAKHKSGQTFNVDKVPGRDWFDSFRIALRSQMNNPVKNTISTGTIWFPEWETPAADGLLTAQFIFDGDIYHYNWHDYKISGERTIDGEPTLEAKPWQGRNFGHGGFVYLDRATFNKAFDIYGTIGLMTAQAKPEDIRTIKLETLQTILVYLQRMLFLIGYKLRAQGLHA